MRRAFDPRYLLVHDYRSANIASSFSARVQQPDLARDHADGTPLTCGPTRAFPDAKAFLSH